MIKISVYIAWLEDHFEASIARDVLAVLQSMISQY